MSFDTTTIWITGDQLTPRNSALAGADRSNACVLIVESLARARQLPYHKSKLVLIFAAMRGFADDLRRDGWSVDYHAEREDYEVPLAEHIAAYRPARFAMMAQSEYGVTERLTAAVAKHGLCVDVTPHANFISSADDFAALFTRSQERVTMETFYRRMRRKTGLLMDGDAPAGGAWNFDAKNRLPPRRDMRFPEPTTVPRREHVRAAIELVEKQFPNHPGTTRDFDLPTTRADALAYADDFFERRLDNFGPYEDAMVLGEARLYHSRLSAAINVGLLHPLELCERAELAYRTGTARLASVEGFIRQLIGWREFIWQVYWRLMPSYRSRNALAATLPVPVWYRDGKTAMTCQREAMRFVLELGWAHHILRLMVLGNFALLAGCEPQAMTDWFWYMFVDGFDWVMVPNVVGMTLHADGGFVGTKPYAASANYINKMSNYCGGCVYDPEKTVGEDACPYNALYWDFMARNEDRFAGNPRMSLPIRNWRARSAEDKAAIRKRAQELLARIGRGERL
ncbi:MAG: cryptochrome/photolyase family protein [Candidatus Eremiobacteraeota bacterium]|nr:cryptochrome/photolyase family protein [Candidatus Eremiobacteraeota bacterium]